MQEQKTSLAPGDIIQDRYMIEEVLGNGGFSTVYLVRNLQAPNAQDEAKNALFALKRLNYSSHQEKVRFAFEGEILKKLNHPALPHFYRIFQDHEHSQDFMLLEYIAGPNLEVLRQKQQDKHFPLSAVLTIMQPIVEAITYLHKQKPPVIHRDIKPANIVVSGLEKRAVLVDFGIAKEYETDATTTAIRHFSPGYGAPEQYSSYGTDLRTDVYGLGATCYALLTGTVPADAFIRITTLVSSKKDPLVPINDMVPAVPMHVAQAIERAMSIGQENRFPTIEDFWLALNTPSEEDSSQMHNRRLLSPITNSQEAIRQEIYPYAHKQTYHSQKRKNRVFLSLCLAFLIIMGSGLGFYLYINTSISTNHISSLKRSAQPTPLPTKSNYYPSIKNMYTGTIHDLLTGTSTTMSLIKISQNSERISGSFVGLHLTSTFTGVLDSSQHIFFTVRSNTNHSPIFFEGAVRSDGNLAGNYCDINRAGQCTGNYGLWTIAPIPN